VEGVWKNGRAQAYSETCLYMKEKRKVKRGLGSSNHVKGKMGNMTERGKGDPCVDKIAGQLAAIEGRNNPIRVTPARE